MLDAVPAYCEVAIGTSRNAKPCVVVTRTEDNLFSIGLALPNDDSMILAGIVRSPQLRVHLVSLSGEPPQETSGFCTVEYRVLTCSIVVQGVPIKLKATSQ